MRSIAGMEQQHGIDPVSKENLQTAKRCLHRYRRFMNYSEYRSHGSPIGSGIVESACKQIVTERLKLSGMRWSHAGARQILTLRSIPLSQTWDAALKKALLTMPSAAPPPPLAAIPSSTFRPVPFYPRQKQNLLLNFRSQHQQIHDMRHLVIDRAK